MVQTCGRPSLALKSTNLCGVVPPVRPQNLEGDMAPQRFLDSLVDDPHPSSPDFSNDQIVTEPPRDKVVSAE